MEQTEITRRTRHNGHHIRGYYNIKNLFKQLYINSKRVKKSKKKTLKLTSTQKRHFQNLSNNLNIKIINSLKKRRTINIIIEQIGATIKFLLMNRYKINSRFRSNEIFLRDLKLITKNFIDESNYYFAKDMQFKMQKSKPIKYKDSYMKDHYIETLDLLKVRYVVDSNTQFNS